MHFQAFIVGAFVTIAASSFHIPAFAGDISAGGSGVILSENGTAVLIDLLNFVPGFTDEHVDDDQLEPSRVTRMAGFDVLDVNQTSVMSEIRKDAERCAANAPSRWFHLYLVALAENHLDVYYTFDDVKAYEHYLAKNLRSKVRNDRIKTLARFDAIMGIVLDAKNWNASGRQTRKAMIFHEAMRRVNAVVAHKFSDPEIHFLVTQSVLCDHALDNAPEFDAVRVKIEQNLGASNASFMSLVSSDAWFMSVHAIDNSTVHGAQERSAKGMLFASAMSELLFNTTRTQSIDDLSNKINAARDIKFETEYEKRNSRSQYCVAGLQHRWDRIETYQKSLHDENSIALGWLGNFDPKLRTLPYEASFRSLSTIEGSKMTLGGDDPESEYCYDLDGTGALKPEQDYATQKVAIDDQWEKDLKEYRDFLKKNDEAFKNGDPSASAPIGENDMAAYGSAQAKFMADLKAQSDKKLYGGKMIAHPYFKNMWNIERAWAQNQSSQRIPNIEYTRDISLIGGVPVSVAPKVQLFRELIRAYHGPSGDRNKMEEDFRSIESLYAGENEVAKTIQRWRDIPDEKNDAFVTDRKKMFARFDLTLAEDFDHSGIKKVVTQYLKMRGIL